MNLTDTTQAEESARELANSFAGKRVPESIEQLRKALSLESGPLDWNDHKVNQALGRMISTAYFKGYMDRHHGEKLRKLYV